MLTNERRVAQQTKTNPSKANDKWQQYYVLRKCYDLPAVIGTVPVGSF